MSNNKIEALMQKVNQSPRLITLLNILCYLCTVASVFTFGYMLVYFVLRSWVMVAEYCAALGLAFVIVSLVRKLINAPRPYQVYDFFTDPPREKKGNSFPSRHAFSAFAIGTLCLFINPVFGIITLVLGLVMCFCRVALGIHFVRDLLCGALIGVCSSLVAALILF